MDSIHPYEALSDEQKRVLAHLIAKRIEIVAELADEKLNVMRVLPSLPLTLYRSLSTCFWTMERQEKK